MRRCVESDHGPGFNNLSSMSLEESSPFRFANHCLQKTAVPLVPSPLSRVWNAPILPHI